MSEKKEDDDRLGDFARAFRKAAPYINSTYVLIGAIALFGWLGWLLDQKLETLPLFFITGLFLGLVVGFYNYIKVLRNLDDQ